MAVEKKHLPEAPHDPPAEYIAPVGEIVTRFARLEYQLSVLARLATRLKKSDQRRLFLKLRAQRLCDTVEMLATFWGVPEQAKEIQVIAKEADRLSRHRDKYVHSVYGYWSDDPKKAPMRFRLDAHNEPDKVHGDPMTVDELVQLASKIKNLEAQAQALTTRMKKKP